MGSRQSEDCVGLNCTSTANRVWYCIDCDSFLCDPCWSQYPPHTGDRKGRDGLEHERTKYNVYVQLRHILNPKYTRDELENLHYRDLDTTWFGIRRTEDGRPSFADHDVYSTLMEEPLSSGAEKHPQLASFIGQTNAGKSTLIKMLIQLQERRHNIETPLFPTPVVGSSTQTHNPTSADVHLYVDPRRCERSTPLLYADCEGFNAGATLPLGAIENRTSVHDGQTLLPRLTPGRTRPLTWADTDEKKTRAFAVAQLYPRILYTFSDVIVFVLRDSRTFEVTTLRPLLEWGEASLETSVNQPTLPHAIIALNSTDLDGPINEWSSETATQNLLDANQGCLHPVNGHPFFLRLAKQWRARNRRKPIKRIIDLIHCYYSTFKVIRIPYKGRYQLLNNQIQGLHKMITESCDTSFAAKREVNMLSNSAELNVYFQSAFEHFTKTLDTPFNFREVSLLNNPIADDFGGHILQLALAIQSHGRRTDCEMIFDNLRYPVASSVMLDCIRHRKGLPEDLFTAYEDKCRDALEEFGDLHAPCEYHTDTEICVNVATNHSSKGHQNAAGKIIKPGRFRSRFKPDQYYPTWSARIREAIRDIHQHLQATLEGEQGVSEETCLLRIHSDVMDRLYAITGSASDFLSHSTCFCCLMQAPQHILPCGHVLCANCVRSYGKTLIGGTTTKSVLCLSCCPLHPGVTQWQPPFIVRFKPDQAGVRLLSLDGGGIRGIVELEVLRAIQRQFSDRIPIRAFFDLIIGTSTGGIIALAMGVKDWRMKRCIEDFIHLCGIAFTPRPMHDVPILKYLIPFRHVAKYETSPLRTVLKNTFGEQRLFGGDQSQCPDHGAKVAVVAADEAGRRAIVLANYSRKDSNDTGERTVSYEFLRRANPKLELKVWEAAAATSATPSYFKPFEHEPTRKTYLDGNVYHNNPISILHHESKLLWPDVADRSPDILLSIGTSQNAAVLTESLSSNSLPSQSGQHNIPLATTEQRLPGRKRSSFFRLHQIFAAKHRGIDSVFSSELAWKHFRAHVNSADELGRNESRYMRINPDIGREPPGLDEINRLKELQRDVRHALKSRENRSQIERVAHVLVASSFYYERTSAARFERNGYFSCTGQICCRFENGSPYLRELGKYFMNQQTTEFQPCFEVEHADGTLAATIPISEFHVNTMTNDASFCIIVPDIRAHRKDAEVDISLRLQSHRSTYSISGFPRTIMDNQAKVPGMERIHRTTASPSQLNSPEVAVPLEHEVDEQPAHPMLSNRTGPVLGLRVSRSEMNGVSNSTTGRTRRRSSSANVRDSLRWQSQPVEEQVIAAEQLDREQHVDPPVFPPPIGVAGNTTSRTNSSSHRRRRTSQQNTHSDSKVRGSGIAETRSSQPTRPGSVSARHFDANSPQRVHKEAPRHGDNRGIHHSELPSTGDENDDAKIRSTSRSKQKAREHVQSSQSQDDVPKSSLRTRQQQRNVASRSTSRGERHAPASAAIPQNNLPGDRQKGTASSNIPKVTRTTRPSHAATQRVTQAGPSSRPNALFEPLQDLYDIPSFKPTLDFDALYGETASELSTTTDATDLAFEQRKVAREERNRARQVPSPVHSENGQSMVSNHPERGRRR